MALAFLRRHRRWFFVFLWVVILAFVILYIPNQDPNPATSLCGHHGCHGRWPGYPGESSSSGCTLRQRRLFLDPQPG
jgi:hypothetical protein